MSIIYTLVARGMDDVLVECNTAAGNFPQITRTILKKLKPNTKLSYTYNAKYFFYFLFKSKFLATFSIISMRIT